MGLPLRTCPAPLQAYVELWRGYDPIAKIERGGTTPYPEDMIPMHKGLAARIESEVIGRMEESPERDLVKQELSIFRGLVDAVERAHGTALARLEAAVVAPPAPDPTWGTVTTAVETFIRKRRTLAELAADHGRHLAYFSEAVRDALAMEPVVPGISVFVDG